MNAELIEEMNEEIKKGNLKEVKTIADNISENEKKISHHGKRADAIVKGMLQHSQTSTGRKKPQISTHWWMNICGWHIMA